MGISGFNNVGHDGESRSWGVSCLSKECEGRNPKENYQRLSRLLHFGMRRIPMIPILMIRTTMKKTKLVIRMLRRTK